MTNLFDLKGRVAVVTGASSGLGADAAKAYAKAGADVAILARRIEKLKDVKSELEKFGAKVIPVQCDVTVEEDIKSAVEEIKNKLGKIDILLNNAGIAVSGGVETLDEKEWDKSFDVNVKGIFLMSKYVVPIMKEQKYGKIVNIASVNAVVANKNDAFIRHSYNSSKSAVVGLTRGMAASYAQYGITVNAVGPALFKSEMTNDTLFKSDEFLQRYSALNPSSRPGEEGEVNGTIIYLSSEASSYVQGQLILVDGGFALI